jgi:GrpB-like predicted nucleotidyltransferase (UPF0157 family)/Ser/Thr protein kinase RdoA (MazF antagonist)
MADAFRESVSLADPDPDWPGRYAAEAALIERELAALDPVVEHIGSTAVPLRAKPIIDIQVAVREAEVPSAVDALRGLGYEHHGQGAVPGREYLIKRSGPAFNVHVFATGNPSLEDNRLIRDYLRANPPAAREYERSKQRAVEQGHVDLLSYSDAKGAHVAAVRDAARAHHHVASILEAFDLGPDGRLSDGPVASGRLGAIWRLDTERGSWAVKQVGDGDVAELLEGAAFQEAVLAAGIPTPAVRRTRTGELIGDCGGVRVRLHAWVDLHDADPNLDPVEVGQLVAGLHRVGFEGAVGLDPWYTQPVGAAGWSELVSALRERRAPFADELDALLPELDALGAYLGAAPRELRTCHRDLWADNVRRTRQGGLCVFDFDNAGLADPSQELAVVLVEYGAAPGRAARIRAAYAEAGGPGRVEAVTDFAMAIAQLSHILVEGCTRWLAATTDAERADNEGWVREFVDQPLTRTGIAALLAD